MICMNCKCVMECCFGVVNFCWVPTQNWSLTRKHTFVLPILIFLLCVCVCVFWTGGDSANSLEKLLLPFSRDRDFRRDLFLDFWLWILAKVGWWREKHTLSSEMITVLNQHLNNYWYSILHFMTCSDLLWKFILSLGIGTKLYWMTNHDVFTFWRPFAVLL